MNITKQSKNITQAETSPSPLSAQSDEEIARKAASQIADNFTRWGISGLKNEITRSVILSALALANKEHEQTSLRRLRLNLERIVKEKRRAKKKWLDLRK